jgi:Ser/Thr protein kinase RdoA (MazF antagonist)
VSDPLLDTLTRAYGVAHARLAPLRELKGRRVMRVDRGAEPAWVVRAFRADDLSGPMQAHAEVLRFLERQSFPACLLVPTRDGATYVQESGWWVLVTTYIPGEPATYSLGDLTAIGALMGRLHNLPAAGDPAVPLSDWRPGVDTAMLVERLARLAERVPLSLRSSHQAYVEALGRADLPADLPQSLIHTDIFPGNTIRTPEGALVLMDWDGAGIGPALVDLGYALISCDYGQPWELGVHPDSERIAAIVAGYCRERLPTPAERSALAGAMRYGPVVRGAWSFAETVDGNDYFDKAWRRWWARYQACDEAAEVALRSIRITMLNLNANTKNRGV